MNTPAVKAPLVAIFGGSFNPVHLGHMRLVVEVLESLAPDRLDIVPAASPPHKGGRSILPFALRVEMLEAAIKGLGRARVSTVEAERDGPSFTSDTLALYAQREPDCRHAFIIGAEDFALVHTWHEWRRLPEFADIVVVPRAGAAREVFTDTVRELWPESAPAQSSIPAVEAAFALPGATRGGHFYYLPLPRLDIRAELVRERLFAGRSVRFLVPDAVDGILGAHPEARAVRKV